MAQGIIGDGIIDTPEEVFEESQQKLWKESPMEAFSIEKVEKRKVMNFYARSFFTTTVLGVFIFLIWLLFFTDLKSDSRDLVNILLGTFVAVLTKTMDYWFKDKDDPEAKETDQHVEIQKANGNKTLDVLG
ncbi:MAG: hypothetical protein QF493_13590 [Rhodospirillales bacterium]|jgi:hypothetical protein|nr:hypothetical protein [Rhodospirillales bacterium]